MATVTTSEDQGSAQRAWDVMVSLHGLMSSVHRQLLVVLAGVLREESWRADGAVDPESWVVAVLGVAHVTATRWVREASALPRLPLVFDAYADGRVAEDRLRHLVTIDGCASESATAAATLRRWVAMGRGVAFVDVPPLAGDPDTPATEDDPAVWDPDLVWLGETHTASQLARLARLLAPPTDIDAKDALSAQRLRLATDNVSGWTKGIFDLYGDVGCDVRSALLAEAERFPRNPDGTYVALDLRLAWALHSLCVGTQERRPDAYAQHAVVVHADVELLAGGHGTAEVTRGPLLAAATASRLACDCWLNIVADGPDGRPVGHGRDRRTASPWLRNLVRIRDGGCRFPGCRRRIWTQIHHHEEWRAKFGRTDLPLLYELCVYHHTFVHEGGWTVHGDPDGELQFVNRDGRVMSSWPQPIPPSLVDFVGETLGQVPVSFASSHPPGDDPLPAPPAWESVDPPFFDAKDLEAIRRPEEAPVDPATDILDTSDWTFN